MDSHMAPIPPQTAVPQPRSDAFPKTDRTSLLGLIDGPPHRRAEAVQHVLERYRSPLLVYVRGSSLRGVLDPIEFVQGFMADRLARESYLLQWAASGMQLRQWLINGMHLYAKEVRRRAVRDATVFVAESSTTELARPEDRRPFEAAWARALLVEAFDIVSNELSESGHARAWDIFRRHFIDGRPYSELSIEFQMRPAALAEASRRVTGLLRQTVRLLLVRDGSRLDDVNSELQKMLQSIEGDRA